MQSIVCCSQKIVALASVAFLVAGTAFSETLSNGLDTGRYQVHPVGKTNAAKKNSVPGSVPAQGGNSVATQNGNSNGNSVPIPPSQSGYQKSKHFRKPASTSESPENQDEPTADQHQQQITSSPDERTNKSDAKSDPGKTPYEEPDWSTQWKALWSESDYHKLDQYLMKIHSEDVRKEMMYLKLMGGVSAIEARSNYSYRDYSTALPQADVTAGVSISPGMSFEISYGQSFAGDISGKPSTHSREHLVVNHIGVGLIFKTYFTYLRRSPVVQYEFGFDDRNTSVNASSTERFSLRSGGVRIGLTLIQPSSPVMSWSYSAAFFPRLTHNEMTNSTNANSGSHKESFRVEAALGGDYKVALGKSLFFDLRLGFERNSFDGTATGADQYLGATPSNVGVSTMSITSGLGYRWGF